MKHFMQSMLLWAAMSVTASAQTFVEDSIKVQGHMRHFVMYLPDGLAEDAPLVGPETGEVIPPLN